MASFGDFIVIMNKREKIGGLLVTPHEYEDFTFCINSCDLFDISFKESPFTSLNGTVVATHIFKKLYR